MLIASEEWAAKRNLPVLAYLTYGQHIANNFVGGDGLLMAPTIAVSKMLDRAGLTLQDFDFYEIHEAFAAQVLCTLKAWEDADYCKKNLGKDAPLGSIDRAKLNVKGSSLAFRTSLRGDRRADRRKPGEAVVRQRRRPRAHLGLHGGWHGRRGHSRKRQSREHEAGCLRRLKRSRGLPTTRGRLYQDISKILGRGSSAGPPPEGKRPWGERKTSSSMRRDRSIRDVAQRLDVNAWARLWDGTRLAARQGADIEFRNLDQRSRSDRLDPSKAQPRYDHPPVCREGHRFFGRHADRLWR